MCVIAIDCCCITYLPASPHLCCYSTSITSITQGWMGGECAYLPHLCLYAMVPTVCIADPPVCVCVCVCLVKSLNALPVTSVAALSILSTGLCALLVCG